MKYRKILLPVDLSEKNRPAVDFARELLDPEAGSILLLHVVETLDLPYEEMREFYEQLAETASARMREIMAKHLVEAHSECEVVFGRRSRSILSYAARNDVDLIVLSSRKVQPDDDKGSFMSISHQVAVFAPCSVILLRD